MFISKCLLTVIINVQSFSNRISVISTLIIRIRILQLKTILALKSKFENYFVAILVKDLHDLGWLLLVIFSL